jgi:WD40 repeat protein
MMHVAAKMYAVEWFPNGERFACGGHGDRTVYVYSTLGQQQSKHQFDDPYECVWELLAVSNSQLVVVVSTNYSPSKYRLCMFNARGNALHVQWQVDGIGSLSRISPLYDGKYLAVGSYESVLHLYLDHTMMIGNGRLVEYRDKDAREAIQETEQIRQHTMCSYGRLCDWWRREYHLRSRELYDIEDVVVWDKKSGDEVKRLAGHVGGLVGITLNPVNPHEFVSYDRNSSFIVQVS